MTSPREPASTINLMYQDIMRCLGAFPDKSRNEILELVATEWYNQRRESFIEVLLYWDRCHAGGGQPDIWKGWSSPILHRGGRIPWQEQRRELKSWPELLPVLCLDNLTCGFFSVLALGVAISQEEMGRLIAAFEQHPARPLATVAG